MKTRVGAAWCHTRSKKEVWSGGRLRPVRGRVRGQRPPRDQGRGSGSRQLQSSLRPGARPLQHSSTFSPNSKFSLNAADEFWDLERNEETKPILLQADQCKKELRSYGHRINLKQRMLLKDLPHL